jgi:hypothetical protein
MHCLLPSADGALLAVNIKSDGKTIAAGDENTALMYSADGKLLAAAEQSFAVWARPQERKRTIGWPAPNL